MTGVHESTFLVTRSSLVFPFSIRYSVIYFFKCNTSLLQRGFIKSTAFILAGFIGKKRTLYRTISSFMHLNVISHTLSANFEALRKSYDEKQVTVG